MIQKNTKTKKERKGNNININIPEAVTFERMKGGII